MICNHFSLYSVYIHVYISQPAAMTTTHHKYTPVFDGVPMNLCNLLVMTHLLSL